MHFLMLFLKKFQTSKQIVLSDLFSSYNHNFNFNLKKSEMKYLLSSCMHNCIRSITKWQKSKKDNFLIWILMGKANLKCIDWIAKRFEHLHLEFKCYKSTNSLRLKIQDTDIEQSNKPLLWHIKSQTRF